MKTKHTYIVKMSFLWDLWVVWVEIVLSTLCRHQDAISRWHILFTGSGIDASISGGYSMVAVKGIRLSALIFGLRPLSNTTIFIVKNKQILGFYWYFFYYSNFRVNTVQPKFN